MINKFLALIIFLFCTGCEYRTAMSKPVHLSYVSRNVDVKIDLISQNNKELSKGKKTYFYYGTMTSQLLSSQKPKEILVIYKNEKSRINLDTTVDSINFWDFSEWDEKGFRKNKIYITFEDPKVDWNFVTMIEED